MGFALDSVVTLTRGVAMPMLGIGTAGAKGDACVVAVREALQVGYRLIDTASIYGNEREVGIAVRESGLPREEIFVTTKIATPEQGPRSTPKALDESLRRLGLDYVDLYLIHWPSRRKRLATWEAMIPLVECGLARSIGVSNFMVRHLEELQTVEETLMRLLDEPPCPDENPASLFCSSRVRPKSYARSRGSRTVAGIEVVVLIPESSRKLTGGSSDAPDEDSIIRVLPAAIRRKFEGLREEIRRKSPPQSIDTGKFLPGHDRFDGNMYRSIPREAWDHRSAAVEVVIASGLFGLVASRDPIPAYRHSMAEPMPPLGKLNRWWHAAGLPEILAEYLLAVRPKTVVDLLSLEYRESVSGYQNRLSGISVKPIDFPGMGRASQPRRGEKVAEILRTGKG